LYNGEKAFPIFAANFLPRVNNRLIGENSNQSLSHCLQCSFGQSSNFEIKTVQHYILRAGNVEQNVVHNKTGEE
jgi:hypothetical protein